MNQSSVYRALLHLVACGLGHKPQEEMPVLSVEEWYSLFDLSEEHGVNGIAAEGFNMLHPQLPEDDALEYRKFQWFGEVMRMEDAYVQYKADCKSLTALMAENGLQMILLKGLACGVNYPNPEHRPYGDVDVYFVNGPKESWNSENKGDMPAWKRADEVIRKMGIKVDVSHHHHTVYRWHETLVENHYDFVNVHAHRSSKRLEQYLKSLVHEVDNECQKTEDGWYMPSAELHAMFLLYHTAAHLSGAGMLLRQLVDWHLFAKKLDTAFDWDAFRQKTKEMGKDRFLVVMEHLCEFCFDGMKAYDDLSSMEKRVLDDMFTNHTNGGLRHLIKDQWKYRLCYSDNSVIDNITMLISHLVRPEVE